MLQESKQQLDYHHIEFFMHLLAYLCFGTEDSYG